LPTDIPWDAVSDTWTWDWIEEDFKVFRDEWYFSEHGPYSMTGIDIRLLDGTTVAYVPWVVINAIMKDVMAPYDTSVTQPLDGETVHILSLIHHATVWAEAHYTPYDDMGTPGDPADDILPTLVVDIWLQVDSMSESMHGGRYEWTVVGRDSHAADSIGAALVTAAFKNKQVEIGNAGFDMMFQEYPSDPGIPYTLRKFGVAVPGWPPDYKDDLYRIALRDDWCHGSCPSLWQVSSSNMIAVGGPLANHLSEYFNDFTVAFFGLDTVEAPFTLWDGWKSKLIALTCWNKTNYVEVAGDFIYEPVAANAYESSEYVGYGVVTTYKDINGTIGLLIYGMNARDTFFVSKFFHEELIYELQEFPPHVQGLIIAIDYYYNPKHPSFSIPEVLGTISERGGEMWDPDRYLGWWHYNWYSECYYAIHKGGIHDP
jgi:hypothetical protein